MQRVLEPEYMDTPQEAAEYQAMDHTAANEAVVQRFLEVGGDRGSIVDLGTGPGDIPILLAQRAPEVRIVAVDAAEEMLRLARPKLASLGLQDRIELRKADVKDLPFPDDAFDGVLSNTILHHIPEPVDMLREAWRVLKPGGVLLIRDLFRPESRAAAQRLVDLHAAGADPGQRKLLFDSFCAALTLEEAEDAARRAGLRSVTVRMVSDRHYDIEVAKTGVSG